MSLSIAVSRSNSVRQRLRATVTRVARRTEAALLAVGEHLLEESLRLVPLDTTALYRDGHVRQEGAGYQTVVIVGYGTYGVTYIDYDKHGKQVIREPSKYALPVHERVWVHHEEGQADYLRTPALRREELRLVLLASL